MKKYLVIIPIILTSTIILVSQVGGGGILINSGGSGGGGGTAGISFTLGTLMSDVFNGAVKITTSGGANGILYLGVNSGDTSVSLTTAASDVADIYATENLNFRTGASNSFINLSSLGFIAGTNGGIRFGNANPHPVLGGVVPIVLSGFGTSPVVAGNSGVAFSVNVGTGGIATGGVLTVGTATAGWNCQVENITSNAANRAGQRTLQTASTTTTVTVQNQTISTGAALAWTASDVLRYLCASY